jgi:hypothetical protein
MNHTEAYISYRISLESFKFGFTSFSVIYQQRPVESHMSGSFVFIFKMFHAQIPLHLPANFEVGAY